MFERELCLTLNLRNNTLGQHFAKFNTPRVERVDVPDRALSEDRVGRGLRTEAAPT
jgi:hypothetical protein